MTTTWIFLEWFNYSTVFDGIVSQCEGIKVGSLVLKIAKL